MAKSSGKKPPEKKLPKKSLAKKKPAPAKARATKTAARSPIKAKSNAVSKLTAKAPKASAPARPSAVKANAVKPGVAKAVVVKKVEATKTVVVAKSKIAVAPVELGKAKTEGSQAKRTSIATAANHVPAKSPTALEPKELHAANGKGKESRAARGEANSQRGMGRLIPPPPPDNGKPRKNNAGYTPRDLENFRELLLVKRRELLGDLRSMEHEALLGGGNSNLSNLPIHMADMGTDNYEQEFTLGLVEKDRQIIREINIALAKLQDGTFGICEGTGNPINRERLEYQPWARFSIEHARMIERNGRPGGKL